MKNHNLKLLRWLELACSIHSFSSVPDTLLEAQDTEICEIVSSMKDPTLFWGDRGVVTWQISDTDSWLDELILTSFLYQTKITVRGWIGNWSNPRLNLRFLLWVMWIYPDTFPRSRNYTDTLHPNSGEQTSGFLHKRPMSYPFLDLISGSVGHIEGSW